MPLVVLITYNVEELNVLAHRMNTTTGNAMSIPCIGATLAAVLLVTDLRDQFRLPRTPSPMSQVPSESEGNSNGSSEPGGFSEAVRRTWPTLAVPGAGYSPQELERFLEGGVEAVFQHVSPYLNSVE